eukprot:TRINITY_DN17257_c0_g1_i1.p1 TRINITY_DN17257_c0_g1~~TRINITY_DN17257_c0_g1_i1.p1  ORF type:complete len:449 (+),score=61.63 TRINITY_DN17257_c0_g1_i1:62-1408(+)
MQQRDTLSASAAGAAAAARLRRICTGVAAVVGIAVVACWSPSGGAEDRTAAQVEETPAPIAVSAVRGRGAIAVLFHEDPYLADLLTSLCANMRFPSPLFLFYTEEERRAVARSKGMVAKALGPKANCAGGEWDVRWEEIPYNQWNHSAPAMYSRRMPLGYRRMIWFWTYVVLTLDCLKEFQWLLRLDTDSAFGSPVTTDPFAIMTARKGVYGYVAACFDSPDYLFGLWHHVQWEMQVLKVGPRHLAEYVIPASCRIRVKRERCRFPHPMFWTNFEVLDLDFWRRPTVLQFLESTHRGVFYDRWGDAPIRAAAVGIFANPKEVVHLNHFTYVHGRCSTDKKKACRRKALRAGNANRIVWSAEVSGVDIGPAASARDRARGLMKNSLLKKPLVPGNPARIRHDRRKLWWQGQCWDERPLPGQIPPTPPVRKPRGRVNAGPAVAERAWRNT